MISVYNGNVLFYFILFFLQNFFFFAKLPYFEMLALSFTDVKLTIGLQGDMPCQITYIQVLSS